MPAKTNDLSPKKSAQYHKINMESDLKSLQQKIMDLESKLQFTHTALEEEPTSMFDLKKNVKFDSQAFDSLNEEVKNSRVKLEPKKHIKTTSSIQPKKIKLEVDLDSLTKKRNSQADEDKFSIAQPLKKTQSYVKIITPRRKVLNNPFTSHRSTSNKSSETKKDIRPISA